MSDVTSLPAVLRRSAARYADRTALVDGERALTYAELDRCVDALAIRLSGDGLHPGDRVGICVERGWMALIGSAALMRLGCAYVPLAIGHPAQRLRHVLDNAELTAALCDDAGRAALDGLEVQTVPITPEVATPPARPHDTVLPGPSRDSTAYLMYTSGSTGVPKGVEITHGNVLAMLSSELPRFAPAADDVWPLQHDHSFDVSVWEMWSGIAVGATLVAVSGEVGRAPELLADLLLRHGATRLHIVPSVFRHLAEVVAEDRLRIPLRSVVFAGEAIDYSPMHLWAGAHDGVSPRWMNSFGITETTVYNTFKEFSSAEVEHASPVTSIGTANSGSPAIVIGDDLCELPAGEVGEIAIGGSQVSRGYFRNPELTAERFRSLPGRSGRWYLTGDLAHVDETGDLRFHGRRDEQVKVRGFRIELGEIDHAMRSVPWIRDAAVVCHNSMRGEPMLTAFVVSAEQSDLPLSGRLRTALADQLPEHMLPRRAVELPQLPVNSNGKTDRRALVASLD